MRLLKIETENVLGLPDGSYAFAKRAQDALSGATVITGPSGAGKTSLLAAIVAGREALAGYTAPEKPERLLRFGAVSGSLRITFELDAAEASLAEEKEPKVELTLPLGPGSTLPTVSKPLRKLFGRFGDRSAVGALEYFPDNRALPLTGSRTVLDQEKRLRPGRAQQKYGGLVPWLLTLAGKGGPDPLKDSLGPMRSALKHLSPELEMVGLDTQDVPELVFAIGGSSVPLSRLSSSQSQAVLLAGTLVRFGLESGLVLIDQPELHHATEDHAQLLRGLAEVARDAQLIIATGSTGVTGAVKASQLLQLRQATGSSSRGHTPAPLPAATSTTTPTTPRPSEPALERPNAGPSVLEAPRTTEPVQPPAEVPSPALNAQLPQREVSHSTPSYLQQQARSPAPYIPISEAPSPPQAASSPPRVVIRPYEPPNVPAQVQQHIPVAAAPAPVAPNTPSARTTGTDEIDTSAFRTRKPLSAEDAAVLERMKQGAAAGAGVDATAFLSPITPAPAGTNQLPFRAGSPSSPSPAVPPSSARAPSAQSGFTMAGSSGARPSMPFMRAGTPNPESIPPGWNIQRYAALCIDLHASGLPAERVLSMAQITHEQRLALDDYWQARMTQDPSLRAEWQAHADRRVAEVRGRR